MQEATRRTAHDRVEAATRRLEKALTLNERDAKALARAEGRGNTERAAELRRSIGKRALQAKAQERILAKYRPIMQMSDYAGRLAARCAASPPAPAPKARKPKKLARQPFRIPDDIPADLPGRRERKERFVPSPADGKPLAVTINVHESPVSYMLAAGTIDEAEHRAADQFRRLYERAGIGNLKAIDPAREVVDGTSPQPDMNVDAMEAQARLREARERLGKTLYGYTVAVVGELVPIKQMAEHYGRLSGKRAEGFVSGQVTAALDLLAELWREKPPTLPKMRSTRESTSGPATEWDVTDKGDLRKRQSNAERLGGANDA
ncbi:hypothetical protein [Ancylobacter mangrovi]|uniref:hypothetical protein n=1 Tax=Ancylobacter mangrovi TaxID=2972472 RepID=UPI0021631BFC|nr:hypothetical protein [Ancylobacter mangrovi]MCS0501605.1 hypothetical protein [Ancylobacter mangrovi]